MIDNDVNTGDERQRHTKHQNNTMTLETAQKGAAVASDIEDLQEITHSLEQRTYEEFRNVLPEKMRDELHAAICQWHGSKLASLEAELEAL